MYFKVKEGKAAIQVDKETGGLPVISPVNRSQEENLEENGESNQVVINMTMKDWKVFGKQIRVLNFWKLICFLFVANKYRGHLPLIS